MTTTTTDTPTARLLVTPDGRRLAWYEFGDPTGHPCVYTTGTPASGTVGQLYHDAAVSAGVRWISPDKPGYGYSDRQPGRTLTDWATDMGLLADHLGLDHFVAAGESGGGPHVLALARYLPERVRTALVLAGMGPASDPGVAKDMKPTNRRLFALALRAPWALHLPLMLMGRMIVDERRRPAYLRKMLAESAPADRALLKARPDLLEPAMRASALAFRAGAGGAVDEMRMFARPWGFTLEDIRVPVVLWHGSEDRNVPVAIARTVAASVPDCTAHIIDRAGHAVALTVMDDIMATVRSASADSSGPSE